MAPGEARPSEVGVVIFGLFRVPREPRQMNLSKLQFWFMSSVLDTILRG